MESVGRHFSQRAAVPPASSVEPRNPITTLRIEIAYKIDGVRAIYIPGVSFRPADVRFGVFKTINIIDSICYEIMTTKLHCWPTGCLVLYTNQEKHDRAAPWGRRRIP